MATKIKNQEIQVVDYRYDEGIRGRVESDISPTITTHSSGYSGMPLVAKQVDSLSLSHGGKMKEKNKLRIRKLSPLECLKLQGFSEEDYNAIKDRFGDSAIYHVAGDSISISTQMALWGECTNVNYRKAINDYVETLRGDYE